MIQGFVFAAGTPATHKLLGPVSNDEGLRGAMCTTASLQQSDSLSKESWRLALRP